MGCSGVLSRDIMDPESYGLRGLSVSLDPTPQTKRFKQALGVIQALPRKLVMKDESSTGRIGISSSTTC